MAITAFFWNIPFLVKFFICAFKFSILMDPILASKD